MACCNLSLATAVRMGPRVVIVGVSARTLVSASSYYSSPHLMRCLFNRRDLILYLSFISVYVELLSDQRMFAF